MIVTCPQCGSEYRVRDDKVPNEGGRIRCPECSFEFVVEAGQQENGPDRGSTSDEGRLDGVAAEMEAGEVEPSVSEDDPTTIESEADEPAIFGDHDGMPVEGERTIEMSSNPFSEQDAELSEPSDETPEGEEPTAVLDRDQLGVDFKEGNLFDDEEDDPDPTPARDFFDDESSGGSRDESGVGGGELGSDAGASSERGAPGIQSPGADGAGGSETEPGPPSGPPELGEKDSPPTSDGTGGPPVHHDGPWNLKAQHGLTYEFPDTEALRDWLIDRDELEQLELSADDSTFYPLPEFPQVADLVEGEGRGPQSGAADAPGSMGRESPSEGLDAPSPPDTPGDAEPLAPSDVAESRPSTGGSNRSRERGAAGGSSSARSQNEPERPGPQPQSPGLPTSEREERSTDRSGRGDRLGSTSRDRTWTYVLYGVLVLLVVIAAAVFLDVSGIYPVGARIPGVPTTAEQTDPSSARSGSTAETSPAPSDEAVAETESPPEKSRESGASEADDEEVDRLLKAAKQSIDNNRMQMAIEKLSAAKLLDPERPKTYDMLARVYKKLGKTDEAKTNRKRAETLRTGGSVPGPDAGGDGDPSVDAGN